MRRAVSAAFRTGIRSLAAVRSLFPSQSGARIITYHSVRPVGAEPGLRSSYVDPQDFDRQLAWLYQTGYQVVSLSDLAERVAAGGQVPNYWVCITFDDGYADNYQHAYPVLKRHGAPFTVFLVTGRIGRDPEFLTVEQVAEMQADLGSFGGHTVDHVSLSSLPLDEARRQILESKVQVEQITGRHAEHFCYPFGHYNAAVETYVREAGYRTCCTEQAGAVRSRSTLLRLRRVGILGTDTLRDFALKVEGAYDWWINTYMFIEEARRRRRGG